MIGNTYSQMISLLFAGWKQNKEIEKEKEEKVKWLIETAVLLVPMDKRQYWFKRIMDRSGIDSKIELAKEIIDFRIKQGQKITGEIRCKYCNRFYKRKPKNHTCSLFEKEQVNCERFGLYNYDK